jgi:hypothetical protein
MFPKFRRLALLTLILFSSAPITHAEWVDPGGRIYCAAEFNYEPQFLPSGGIINRLNITLDYFTQPQAFHNFIICKQQPNSWIFDCEVGWSANKPFSVSKNRLTTDSRDHWENTGNGDTVCKEVKELFNLSVP